MIRLKKLSLKNFKGIKKFDLSPDGNNITSIYGQNESGKTTLADGFSWLLFGKDSLNSAVFDIKPLDLSGEAAHGLEHIVEATLESGETETILKKVYSEKWVKRRGSATKEFTGHTIDHFIDGVPVKQKEYTAAVNDICDESIFRLLTSPRHFNEVLHWQERRKLLLEVCGDITDADVIASDQDLSDLPGILGKRKLEDHKKVISGRRAEINRELDKIPVRIDEIKGSEVETRDKETVSAALNLTKEDKKDASDILKEIKAGGESAVLTTQLREIENKISKIDNDQAAEDLKAQRVRNKELGRLSQVGIEAGDAVNAATKKYDLLVTEQSQIMATIKTFEQDIVKYRELWHKEDAKIFEYEQSSTCPTCGQSLPEEKLEAAREKALSAFNEAKAQKLVEITGDGKAKAVNISLDKTNLAKIEKQINVVNAEIKAAQKKSIEATETLNQFKNEVEDKEMALAMVLKNPERVALIDQKLGIEKQITDLEAGVDSESITDAEDAIEAIESRIVALTGEILQVEANKRIDVRIQELKDQERKLSAEFEDLERQLFLCESFIRSKVGMLEAKINSKFELARFQLFTNNINGGLDEVCNTTFKGVPYASMNNAARINIGLDICNTLSEHFDKGMPCFIDNAESVTDIHPTVSQQIRLVVSPEDKTMRVE